MYIASAFVTATRANFHKAEKIKTESAFVKHEGPDFAVFPSRPGLAGKALAFPRKTQPFHSVGGAVLSALSDEIDPI